MRLQASPIYFCADEMKEDDNSGQKKGKRNGHKCMFIPKTFDMVSVCRW
jgi:hypothetical protein